MTGAARETVLLVHGLWLPAWSLAWLARRLRRAGFEPRLFAYATVAHSLSDNACALRQTVAGLRAPVVHYVGYSLGGLVVRALLELEPQLPPGRIVTLGTPHCGSASAQAVARYSWGPRLLGRGVAQLCADVPASWRVQTRELGSLAGSRSAGLGRLFAPLPAPNDGTVAVAETRLAWASDHIVLPVSHVGMLWSRVVAYQTAHFLRSGRFDR